MEILAGLSDHQVLQRSKQNLSETHVVVRISAAGNLQVRVTKNNRPVPKLNGKKLAAVQPGEFGFRLTGIPVGGPYQITLRVVGPGDKPLEQVRVDDVLVGDVWILGGQSNMEGIGYLKDALKPIPQVRAFYMDDRWAPAKDPIHNLGQAVDPVHIDLNGGVPCQRAKHVGTGPGVAFGQKMFKLSGVPQGLLACAHGGTSMAQWDPELREQGGKSLYGATLRRLRKNGQKVAGVVWYQGCSDAINFVESAYTDNMEKLVTAFRRDCDNPKLPIVMVQIAGYFTGPVSTEINRTWLSVQDQQRRLPEKISNLLTVPAIDLELDDVIHVSGRDQHRLGTRLAQAAWTLVKGKKAQKPPITLKNIKTATDPQNGCLAIHVAFNNVEGVLEAKGRPAGFVLVNANGEPVHSIYRVDLEGNKAILRTGLTDFDESNTFLCYGYGVHTYCNLTDSADRAVPVLGCSFKFFEMYPPRKIIKKVRLSKLLPGVGKLQTLTCPDIADPALEFTARQFSQAFLDLHLELEKCTDDAVVYFTSAIDCKENMKLQIGLGYDGPVKLWLDGREVFYDPAGTNPALADKGKVYFDATAGRHEIVVALSANFGRAWGILLHLYRVDVTRDQLKAGRDPFDTLEILG